MMQHPPALVSVTLEGLTEAASVAAMNGQWSLVEEYYKQREALLVQAAPSQEILARVQALDQEVAARVYLAQAGVKSLLHNAMIVRQRLKEMRRWTGGWVPNSGTIERRL